MSTLVTSEIGNAFGEFLGALVPFEQCRAVCEHKEAGFSPALWAEIAAGGWLETALRGDGERLPSREVLATAEQVGARLLPGPFALTTTFVAPLIESAFPTMVDEVTSGAAIVAPVLPRLRWRDGALGLALPRATGCGALDGVFHGVAHAQSATHLLVAFEDASGIPALMLLTPSDEGVTVGPEVTLDLTCRTATVSLGAALAPPERVARVGALGEELTKALFLALLALSAQSIGGIGEVLNRTVAYVSKRKQFDVPVGSFQAVKHALADVHTTWELGRGVVYDAADRLDEGLSPTVAVAILVARLHAAKAFTSACEVAIQCHGGAGFTWEQGLHYWYRSSLRMRSEPFDTTDLRRLLAQAVPAVL